jgi:glyoxylase-like metal-dependent hydrolase (beta-lactamase superfamily II)
VPEVSAAEIATGLFQVSLRTVNAFLIDDGGGVTVVDAGNPGDHRRILAAVAAIGRRPADVSRILVTHAHPDHHGGLARLRAATGAAVHMHPVAAALTRRGLNGRRLRGGFGPAGIAGGLALRLTRLPAVEPVETDREVSDGDRLDGGVRVIGTPGHAEGHVSFLWGRHGGVLLAGDAAANMLRLGPPIFLVDPAETLSSLARLSAERFEIACFGHGRAIARGAGTRFRRRWPQTAAVHP